MRKAYLKSQARCLKQYEKRFDQASQCYYYVSTHTGEITWDKPKMMGPLDVPDPPDEWREMVDPSDGTVYFMNPGTGQSSWLSQDDAAYLIQRCVRNKQAADIGRPTMAMMIKALRLIRESEEKFNQFPDRLSSLVNWAMVLHTQYYDFDEARNLYKQASEISAENPVLLRSYALFLLATCEPPRKVTFNRAYDMLRSAEVRDPTREKFKVAEDSLFLWSVISNPKNPKALLNYAILLQCIIQDFDQAEKFYRRALDVAPDDRMVVKNYEDFETQRLPGGRCAGGGPSLSAVKTSQVQDTRPEWGEWQRMYNTKAREEKFANFWYNTVTQATLWDQPVWTDVWEVRRARAEQTNDMGAWKELWDPTMEAAFYWNCQTNEFSINHPRQASKQLPAEEAAGPSPLGYF